MTDPEMINLIPNWFYWILTIVMAGALIFIFKYYIGQQAAFNRQIADSIKVIESFVQVQNEKNKNYDKDIARLDVGTKSHDEIMKQMTLTLKHMDETLSVLNYERIPRSSKRDK